MNLHIPVFTPQQMRQLESLLLKKGVTEKELCTKAGKAIAHTCLRLIEKKKIPKNIYLLVGKGNNGADALSTGFHLLKEGAIVVAFMLFPPNECSTLCQQQFHLLQKAGGRIVLCSDIASCSFPEPGLIIDGILGIGTNGPAKGAMGQIIDLANRSSLPIVAIDLPSGLDAETGIHTEHVIKATLTVYLEFPKIGIFLKQAPLYVGEIHKADLDMDPAITRSIVPTAYLFSSSLKMPSYQVTQHKYERGQLLLVGGSKLFPGASFLASKAAMKTGAGLVRAFHFKNPFPFPPEVIAQPYNFKKIEQELTRSKALVIGSGIGKSWYKRYVVKKLLSYAKIPTLIDADGLQIFTEKTSPTLPAQTLLTPHTGEMQQLLGSIPLSLPACVQFSQQHRVYILLKGKPNFFFSPHAPPLIMSVGDPALATAGSGDVLAGIIAALMAQKMPIDVAAILGALIHGNAGKVAIKSLTPYCVNASDIIDYLPSAIAALL